MRIYLLALMGLCTTLACSSENNTPPVLKNLALHIAAYDSATGLAGSILFAESEFSDRPFLEFAATVGDGNGGSKRLPTFEYHAALDAEVIAPIDGIVNRVTYQDESSDYSIWLKPGANSAWTVEIDHVKNITVSVGDTVTAGTILGVPGTWIDTMGRTELMLSNNNMGYCPLDYFDPDTKATFTALLSQLMSDWESYSGDSEAYDEAGMHIEGCLLTQYTTNG